jgi:hypothetical protein
MSEQRLEFIADPFDRLVPQEEDTDGTLAAASRDEWRVLSPGPELWIALRQGERGMGGDLLRFHPGLPAFGGDLAEMPASELLDLLRRTGRSGALIVSGEGVERAMLFRDGNVLWATSTHLSERVDELISRVDMVERAVLLRTGLGMDANAIVRKQARLVVRGLLGERSGAFCFLRATDPASLPALPGIDTEALLGECLLSEFSWAHGSPEDVEVDVIPGDR